jgi:glycosyltransferase involved in cell wall biosynthesis
MRRILIVSHTYVAPETRGKLRALAARDLDVTVGVPQRWKEPVLGRLVETTWERQGGVEIFPIPVRDPGRHLEYRFGRRALASLIRDKRPDVIQIEEEPIAAATRQVARIAAGLRVPVVLFCRESLDRRLPWTARWRRRRTLRHATGLAAASEAVAAVLRQATRGAERPPPVAVIPQLGVQVPPTPEHQTHEGQAIGYVGRLVPARGVDTLLQALAESRDRPWRLIIVGDGPERERLESLASKLRLAARVRWAGALPPDHLARLWAELDVLVLPSRNVADGGAGSDDAHGHVLVEAMAHEVAVVGTEVGVIPEVIGDAGLLAPPDDPAALAAALRRLAAGGGAERLPFAKAGRARAMRLFSDDAVAERTIEFWRSVLTDNG